MLHIEDPQLSDIMGSLAEYRKKLMKLEQANRARLKEAREEQDKRPPLGLGQQQPEKASLAPKQDEHKEQVAGSKKRSRIDQSRPECKRTRQDGNGKVTSPALESTINPAQLVV